MKKRHKNKKRGSKRPSFSKTASKVNRKNGPRAQPAMRGGIRL